MATRIGVLRRRIGDYCGGVKNKDIVLKSQKNTENFRRNPVKQKQDLEKQIVSAERRLDVLSEEKKMRLRSRKERQNAFRCVAVLNSGVTPDNIRT